MTYAAPIPPKQTGSTGQNARQLPVYLLSQKNMPLIRESSDYCTVYEPGGLRSLLIDIYRELPPALNGNKGMIRMHFSQYDKILEKWVWLFKAAMGELRVRFDGPVLLLMHRYHCGLPLDRTNALASLKIPEDALVRCGILANDSNDIVANSDVMQTAVKRNEVHTRIEIREVR